MLSSPKVFDAVNAKNIRYCQHEGIQSYFFSEKRRSVLINSVKFTDGSFILYKTGELGRLKNG